MTIFIEGKEKPATGGLRPWDAVDVLTTDGRTVQTALDDLGSRTTQTTGNPFKYFERLQLSSGLNQLPTSNQTLNAANSRKFTHTLISEKQTIGGIVHDVPFFSNYYGEFKATVTTAVTLRLTVRFYHFSNVSGQEFVNIQSFERRFSDGRQTTVSLTDLSSPPVQVPLGTLNIPGGPTFNIDQNFLETTFPYRVEIDIESFDTTTGTVPTDTVLSNMELVDATVVFWQLDRLVTGGDGQTFNSDTLRFNDDDNNSLPQIDASTTTTFNDSFSGVTIKQGYAFNVRVGNTDSPIGNLEKDNVVVARVDNPGLSTASDWLILRFATDFPVSATEAHFLDQTSQIESKEPADAITGVRIGLSGTVLTTIDTGTFGQADSYTSSSSDLDQFLYLIIPKTQDATKLLFRNLSPDDSAISQVIAGIEGIFTLTALGDATFDVYQLNNFSYIQGHTLTINPFTRVRIFFLDPNVRIIDSNIVPLDIESLDDEAQSLIFGDSTTSIDNDFILNNFTVNKDTIPPDQAISSTLVKWKPGAQWHDITLYNNGNVLPKSPGTYSVAVVQPNEVIAVGPSNSTVSTLGITKATDGTRYNVYRVIFDNDVKDAVSDMQVEGGVALVHTIRMSGEFSANGETLIDDHTISDRKLTQSLADRFITQRERDELNTLQFEQLNNLASIELHEGLFTGALLLFNQPTTDGAAITNEFSNADISLANSSAAGTIKADSSSFGGGGLTGPGLVGGGIDVVSANQELHIDNQGILVVATLDALPSTEQTVWDIGDSAVALLADSEGFLLATARQTTTQQTIQHDVHQGLFLANGHREFEFYEVAEEGRQEFWDIPDEATDGLVITVSVQRNINGIVVGPYDLTLTVPDVSVTEVDATPTSPFNDGTQFRLRYRASAPSPASPTGLGRVFSLAITDQTLTNVVYRGWVNIDYTASQVVAVNEPLRIRLEMSDNDGRPVNFTSYQRLTIATHIFEHPTTQRISYQNALNGLSFDDAIVEDTNILVTGVARFDNPRIEFGGPSHNFSGVLQKLYVGKLRSDHNLRNSDIAHISGQYNTFAYGLSRPPGQELVMKNKLAVVSPNGTVYEITVSDAGVLGTTTLTAS